MYRSALVQLIWLYWGLDGLLSKRGLKVGLCDLAISSKLNHQLMQPLCSGPKTRPANLAQTSNPTRVLVQDNAKVVSSSDQWRHHIWLVHMLLHWPALASTLFSGQTSQYLPIQLNEVYYFRLFRSLKYNFKSENGVYFSDCYIHYSKNFPRKFFHFNFLLIKLIIIDYIDLFEVSSTRKNDIQIPIQISETSINNFDTNIVKTQLMQTGRFYLP